MEAAYTWRRIAGLAALVVLLLWLVAFLSEAVIMSHVFPNDADRFVPAKIETNVVAATLDGTTQLLMGTALVALAFGVSYYVTASLTPLTRVALLAGVVGGVFMIAAGAGLQENVFVAIFRGASSNAELAAAMGVPDVTLINATNALVAGGLRSTAAYATGWAMVLWCVSALRNKRLPRLLNWIGIATGVLYALTVWIGPLTGPIAFVGMLIWHAWLGIYVLRSRAPAVARAEALAATAVT